MESVEWMLRRAEIMNSERVHEGSFSCGFSRYFLRAFTSVTDTGVVELLNWEEKLFVFILEDWESAFDVELSERGRLRVWESNFWKGEADDIVDAYMLRQYGYVFRRFTMRGVAPYIIPEWIKRLPTTHYISGVSQTTTLSIASEKLPLSSKWKKVIIRGYSEVI